MSNIWCPNCNGLLPSDDTTLPSGIKPCRCGDIHLKREIKRAIQESDQSLLNLRVAINRLRNLVE